MYHIWFGIVWYTSVNNSFQHGLSSFSASAKASKIEFFIDLFNSLSCSLFHKPIDSK